MFDLTLTQKLLDLFKIDPNQRNSTWLEQFYASVPNALMFGLTSQVIQGPDGFPYFSLAIPRGGESFEGFCISRIIDECLENGYGASILDDSRTKTLWVFSYGDLSSYKQYGRFDGDPMDEKNETSVNHVEILKKEREVLIASPDESFLPKAARIQISKLMKSVGITNPSVALVVTPWLKPSRKLTFNVGRNHFKNLDDLNQFMYRLSWFLPRSRGLISSDPFDSSKFLLLD